MNEIILPFRRTYFIEKGNSLTTNTGVIYFSPKKEGDTYLRFT